MLALSVPSWMAPVSQWKDTFILLPLPFTVHVGPTTTIPVGRCGLCNKWVWSSSISSQRYRRIPGDKCSAINGDLSQPMEAPCPTGKTIFEYQSTGGSLLVKYVSTMYWNVQMCVAVKVFGDLTLLDISF